MRALLALAIVLGLSACATISETPDAEALAKIRKIGAVSVVAQEYNRRYTGVTVFGNEFEETDIAQWRIDDDYEVQMRAALAEVGPAEAVTIRYSRKDLAPLREQGPDWEEAEGALRAIAASNGVDALVVLVARSSEDFLAGTNQYFGGAGTYARGMGWYRRRYPEANSPICRRRRGTRFEPRSSRCPGTRGCRRSAPC